MAIPSVFVHIYVPGDRVQHRDLVVIGASAGGIEALKQICAALPADLDAAVLVVIHTSAQSNGLLSHILGRAGPLAAQYARDGQRIQKARIFIAPGDFHMMVEDGHLRVIKGPRENRHRPAIDPTFRSAALSYGNRVIGVVLTGSLDDGTSGLMTIAGRGGAAVVQDPSTALFPGMPTNAMMRVPDAKVVPLREIPRTIVELVSEDLSGKTRAIRADMPNRLRSDTQEAEYHMPEIEGDYKAGKPSQFACPECGGVLWEIDQAGLLRFRCRVGHAYTAEYLNSEQGYALETSLWAALRTLEESASLYRRLAERAQMERQNAAYTELKQRAKDAESNANTLREFLMKFGKSGPESEIQSDAA